MLILLRHGESVGNLARERASATSAEVVETDGRDADVPLSPRGDHQAQSVGRWLAAQAPADRPESVWSSPYVRAATTAATALRVAGMDPTVRLDERLRDRDLGVLDGLTGRGVAARFPAEAARRARLGKLYHRPPGGESWADVALRVRSLLADLDHTEPGRRVLVVTHDAVVLLLRFVCEGLTETTLLQIERETVPNASVTRLLRPTGQGPWTLGGSNDTAHLDGRVDGAGGAQR